MAKENKKRYMCYELPTELIIDKFDLKRLSKLLKKSIKDANKNFGKAVSCGVTRVPLKVLINENGASFHIDTLKIWNRIDNGSD